MFIKVGLIIWLCIKSHWIYSP